MSQAQLKTASRMTSLQPIQNVKTTPPTARPTSIALTATPAPAMGPEDELLFDPDEEQYGEAGPGGGYVAKGTNIPLGYQQTSKNLLPSSPPTKTETEPPMIIDLSDPVEKTPTPATTSVMSGAFFWIVLISGLVTCSLCLLYFGKGGSSSSTPPPYQSFGDPGFGSDGLGGLGGGLGSGMGGGLGSGMGSGGGLYGGGGGGYGGF